MRRVVRRPVLPCLGVAAFPAQFYCSETWAVLQSSDCIQDPQPSLRCDISNAAGHSRYRRSGHVRHPGDVLHGRHMRFSLMELCFRVLKYSRAPWLANCHWVIRPESRAAYRRAQQAARHKAPAVRCRGDNEFHPRHKEL